MIRAEAPRLTPQALATQLYAARQGGNAERGLFEALQERLACNEGELSALLWQEYGVVVISPTDWVAVRPLQTEGLPSQTSPGVVPVLLGQRKLLLCPDPWSEMAAQALSVDSNRGTELALARRPQWEQAQRWQTSTTKPDASSSPRSGRADSTCSSAVAFVDGAILQAYMDGASDIHFETSREAIMVKFRLDGVMVTGETQAGVQFAEEVISRIKVMAQLDITERRRPQDGRIHWALDSQTSMDLRVSIMPSIFGEDAVLRLLDKAQLRHEQKSLTLDSLGFDVRLAGAIRQMARSPHGMLLITGPTGSGKTTTVYAALSEVNNGLEKIITIEDPVEYELPGVLQIPVNEQKGLTFATGLRSILRHDPDKILVGEIRDPETAEIAVQSALTGHLVFTTVHANSLFDVLGRFQHFSIDPFALASALNGIVVQRLMRKICPHCRDWREITGEESQHLSDHGIAGVEKLPVACGCEHCRQSGYKGRFVVAEVHVLDETLRDLIIERASMRAIRAALYKDGGKSLVANALAAVCDGTTTMEELERVVGFL